MKTRNLLILTILFALFLSIQSISAANVTINPGDSIQNAIDNSNPGDTIIMNIGIYNQSNINITKELTLTGATNNPDDVIIDAQENGRVIEIPMGINNVKIQGLTITNGYFEIRGAGISNKGGTQTQPTQIINCKLTNNNATFEGGAIMNYGNLTITNCTLTNNTVGGNGGGICNSGNLTIIGSNIQQNTAISSMGGGICNWDTLAIRGSTIHQNQGFLGGGVLNGGELTITDSIIQQNLADTGGGVNNFETLTITGCTVRNNNAKMGGGISNWNNLTVNGCVIINNTVTGVGSYGGGIFNMMGTTTITDSTIQKNAAENGGGICNWDNLTLIGSNIQQNTATRGGAIFNDHLGEVYGVLTANFNRIVDNTPNAVQCSSGSVNALYNWWGSNNPDFAAMVNGSVSYDPWLVMRYSVNPTNIQQGQNSNLMADFRYDSQGAFHDSASGHLPDYTPVIFTTTLGNVGSKSVVSGTINGIATALLRGDEAAGEALTSATLDNQTLTVNVTITKAASAKETIEMQSTGIPINYLIMAILMVIVGLAIPKRK